MSRDRRPCCRIAGCVADRRRPLRATRRVRRHLSSLANARTLVFVLLGRSSTHSVAFVRRDRRRAPFTQFRLVQRDQSHALVTVCSSAHRRRRLPAARARGDVRRRRGERHREHVAARGVLCLLCGPGGRRVVRRRRAKFVGLRGGRRVDGRRPRRVRGRLGVQVSATFLLPRRRPRTHYRALDEAHRLGGRVPVPASETAGPVVFLGDAGRPRSLDPPSEYPSGTPRWGRDPAWHCRVTAAPRLALQGRSGATPDIAGSRRRRAWHCRVAAAPRLALQGRGGAAPGIAESRRRRAWHCRVAAAPRPRRRSSAASASGRRGPDVDRLRRARRGAAAPT